MVIGMLFASMPVKTAHAASGSESESNNTAETADKAHKHAIGTRTNIHVHAIDRT